MYKFTKFSPLDVIGTFYIGFEDLLGRFTTATDVDMIGIYRDVLGAL